MAGSFVAILPPACPLHFRTRRGRLTCMV